jgi:hypothetical protein
MEKFFKINKPIACGKVNVFDISRYSSLSGQRMNYPEFDRNTLAVERKMKCAVPA